LTVDSPDEAVPAIGRLTGSDAIVVLSRDPDLYGPALVAALSSAAGYLSAKGSRSRRAERADWLRSHGVAEERIAGIRGPAGLPIGAATSAEIAASIVADIIAVRRGADAASWRERALANG
jgi:xanthine dehydrogenase accessory factor